MPTITITQTAATPNGYRANVQFDGGPTYPVTIENHFGDKLEKDLRWYYEEWVMGGVPGAIGIPSTHEVRAAEIASRIPTYGHALFHQLFADQDLLFEYKTALREGGVSHLRFEVRGHPPSTPSIGKRSKTLSENAPSPWSAPFCGATTTHPPCSCGCNPPPR